MNAIWTILWKVSLTVNMLFDGIHTLCGGWSLYPVSAVTGILMLLIFKATSNQSAIKRVKDRMKGGILEMRLFKDDIRVMAFATLKLLWSNVRYMRYALPPLIVMIVPVILIMVQLDQRYGRKGFSPGERRVLTVKVTENVEGQNKGLPAMEVVCEDKGVVVEPSVRMPASRETSWRLFARDPGTHVLKILMYENSVGEKKILDQLEMPFCVTDKPIRLSQIRRVSAAGFTEAVLEPGGSPIPKGSGFASVRLEYPKTDVSFLGWETSWIWPFLIVSLVIGFALKGIFRVQI